MTETIDYCAGGIGEVPDTDDLQQYFPLQGDPLTGKEEDPAGMPQSRAGTFSKLRVSVLSHDRGTTTLTLREKVSGTWGDTTIKVSFNGTGTFEDNTHTEPFSVGDNFAWEFDFAERGTTVISYVSLEVEYT